MTNIYFRADSSFLACDCGSYLCCAGLWLAQMAVWKSWLTHTLWGGQWTFIHGSLVLSSPEIQRKTSFTLSLQLIWSLICVYISLKDKHNLSSSIFKFFLFRFSFPGKKDRADSVRWHERKRENLMEERRALLWQTMQQPSGKCFIISHTQLRLEQ